MKHDQQGRDLPFSARQPLPGQLGYRQLGSHQLRRGGRRFVIGTRQLVTTSLLLLLLFTVWRTASLLMYHHTPQSSSTTQVAFNPQNAVLAAQVDHLLANMVTHQQFSGSVLIAHSDQVLLSKGYGMADWEKQVPNTPHTKFYLGSTTKQFTAMAILILQQENKLHVHDHLCSYITPCPPAWQPVTIHELLTHTSGIPELDDANVLNASPQSWINHFDGVPLVFAPGSEFSYCNVCYQILGYVVEQVAREPYSTFLQQTIFDPLQMKNTGFDPHYLSLPDHAVGYASWRIQDVPLGWDIAPQWSFLFGAGLLYSTVEDLYRWDQALSRHSLISEQSLDEAFTPYVASQYAGSSYGYGWFIAQAPSPGHRLIWHDGRVNGFRTYNGRYPDDGITIIFLSNLSTLDELALARTLERVVFAYHDGA